MEVQLVSAGKGWQWIVDGYALFRKSPAMWIAITLLLGAIWLVSMIIPLLGPLLFNLFSPLLFAGLMVGCRALEKGEALEVRHLFAGFADRAAPLVTIGGVYLIGTILVVCILLIAAGGLLFLSMLAEYMSDMYMLGFARP